MNAPDTYVRVELPTWLWGGDPTGFATNAGLRSRRDGDFYVLQTVEAYENRPHPRLISVKTLLSSSVGDRLDLLATKAERIEPPMAGELAQVLEARRAKAEAGGELVDMFNHLRLATYAVSTSDLPAQVREFHRAITAATLVEEPDNHPFEAASVHFIEVSAALLHRLKLASVWLRIEHDPKLASGELSHMNQPEQNNLFGSSQGLSGGVYMLDAYLGPLLACLTPGVWAVQVQRTFGNILFSLGRTISGTAGDPVEPLQLISVPGPSRSVETPVLRPESTGMAIQRWIGWLDDLFGVVSDLAVFADTSGKYQAAVQLQAMLTVEQVFRRTTSLMVAHRDANARLALAFTVLDSVSTLLAIDFDRLCTLSHAQKTLARIEDALDDVSADVILPVARRAVLALEEMQGGFFIAKQLGLSDLPLFDGRETSFEDGIARYLKLLRDATHGHGSNKPKMVQPTKRLLAHHDGDIPHDLGLLAYLYLVDLLIDPHRLRQVLRKQARRSG